MLRKRTFQNLVLNLSLPACLLAVSLSSTCLYSRVSAQTLPSFWPYQGLLFDSNGQAIEGNVSLLVRIYDSLDSNVALWEASTNNVSVRGGSFSVDLGQLGGDELRQLIEQTRAQYIGITVNNGVELSPRTRIGSLPYATLSGNALKLNGINAEDFVSQDDLNTLSEQVNTAQQTVQGIQEGAEATQEAVQTAQNTANAAQETAQAAQEASTSAQNTANTAQETAQAAQEAATNAQNTANAAQETAQAAQEAATNAQNTANTAQETAQAAQEATTNAQEAAQAAQNTANTAQAAATNAQNTANAAQETAQAAQNAANAAQGAAQAAQEAATNAQNTANAAQESANTAQETANAAQETANSALTEAAARLLIESYEYLNADQSTVLINNILDGLNYLNATQVSQLITDALANLDVISSQTFQTQIQVDADARTALRNELREQINALSQRVDQLQTTIEQVQQDINSANDAANNAQNTADEANTLAQANAVAHGQLETTVTGLQDQVNALDGVIDNLPNVLNASAFILGVSDTASNGWFRYNNQQGVRAAGEMCKDSYPNHPNAHYCSLSEVQQALSVGNYDNSINNVDTWIYTTVPRDDDGFKSYCQSLLYLSGHAASGTSLTIKTDFPSVSGGTGIQLVYTNNLSCGNERKILCCR